jgi:hypothetical protein
LGPVDADSLKKTLMKAAVHYHPDKIPSPGELSPTATPEEVVARTEALKWKYLCAEIAKLVNAKYMIFKS